VEEGVSSGELGGLGVTSMVVCSTSICFVFFCPLDFFADEVLSLIRLDLGVGDPCTALVVAGVTNLELDLCSGVW
jgi:hypothetical protein